MEPITLLHSLEVERRLSPAHVHRTELRRARAAARRTRLTTLARALLPASQRSTARVPQPCGC